MSATDDAERHARLLRALLDPDRRGPLLALIDDLNPLTGAFAMREIPCYVGGVDINSLTPEEAAAWETKIAARNSCPGGHERSGEGER